jgi:hypothetical protein
MALQEERTRRERKARVYITAFSAENAIFFDGFGQRAPPAS